MYVALLLFCISSPDNSSLLFQLHSVVHVKSTKYLLYVKKPDTVYKYLFPILNKCKYYIIIKNNK